MRKRDWRVDEGDLPREWEEARELMKCDDGERTVVRMKGRQA